MKSKILVKVVIAILLSVVLAFVANMLMPVLGNDVAIDQFKNDDAYFIAMESWQSIQQVLTYSNVAIWSLTIGFIVRDIYNYVKTKTKKENEK